jgi:hypothetical protein
MWHGILDGVQNCELEYDSLRILSEGGHNEWVVNPLITLAAALSSAFRRVYGRTWSSD